MVHHDFKGTEGYIRMRYYAADSCSGSISLERGYYANYCYRAGDLDYYKFSFTKGQPVLDKPVVVILLTRNFMIFNRGLQRLGDETLRW